MHKNIRKITYAILFILPFVLGTAGYWLEGERVIDSLYDAFALYAINPVSDVNNWMIILAKWGAPFVLASGVVMVLQGITQRLKECFISLHKDATAIYSDSEYGTRLIENLKRGILVTDGRLRDVRDHILLFSRDMDNLNYYQRHKEALKGRRVYLQLNETDSFLLRENRVHFFNLNELIARNYWKEHHLLSYFREGKAIIRIAILGFSPLGQQLLKYGLLNNIYDLGQKIEYHIWGDSLLYEHVQENLELMNQDRIIYHGDCWEKDVQEISVMDRIIVTQENQLELLQALLYLCEETEIHYFNPREAVLEHIYKTETMVSFGSYSNILTERNIKSEELYRAAKEQNYRYACLYGNVSGDEKKKEQEMEEQWELLDGFTKGSNIASADYHEIRKLLMREAKKKGKELTKDELGRLEHIRWCRYHSLNHWKYGVLENGKNRDAARRIHTCLVPFDELTQEEKNKDYEAVEVLLELMPIDER